MRLNTMLNLPVINLKIHPPSKYFVIFLFTKLRTKFLGQYIYNLATYKI